MTDKLAPSERHAFEHGGRTVYEWNQTFQEVTVYVATPPGVRGKDLYVEISGRHVKLGIKPNPPYLDVSEPPLSRALPGTSCASGLPASPGPAPA